VRASRAYDVGGGEVGANGTNRGECQFSCALPGGVWQPCGTDGPHLDASAALEPLERVGLAVPVEVADQLGVGVPELVGGQLVGKPERDVEVWPVKWRSECQSRSTMACLRSSDSPAQNAARTGLHAQ
jgi:hypothetical protein